MTGPKGIKTEGVGLNPNILPVPTMPLTPAQLPEASNTAIKPITDNVPMDIDVEDPVAKAVAAAKEQLRVAMEAQARDQKHCEFAKQYWRLQRIESQKTRSLDREAAMEACSATIMVVGAWITHVSFYFLWLLFRLLTLYFSYTIWSRPC